MPVLSLFNPDAESAVTVAFIVESYLTWLKARVDADDYDADAYKDNVRDLRRFARCFCQPADQCDQSDLLRFVELHPQWKAAATKRRICAYVIACFNWAANTENSHRLIDFCPYKLPKAISSLPYKSRRRADPREYIALMRFGSRPLRRALFFIRRTGVRSCEMSELLWTEVFLDEAQPYICKCWHKNRRRTHKPRVIGLDIATANWLRALKRNAGRTAHVFTNCDGEPWKPDSFSQHLRRHAERIGLDEGVAERVSAYCFRHAYACDGVKNGLSERQVGDQMGTSEAMIRKVYSPHTTQDVTYLANIANGVMRRKKPK